ncbi:MAG: hypothetical protein Q8P18_18020 [Pseudomonadota bacterium]|nr:hypothetical protein [Pseudomonadota bacterium]
MLFTSTVLALALALPDAAARDVKSLGIEQTSSVIIDEVHSGGTVGFRVVATASGDTIANISAEVESDAGEETVTLVESDAWLHGAATIGALPTVDASITLTVYDRASASLRSFSGKLGADGSVSVSAVREGGDGGECMSRVCDEAEAAPEADLEILAAEVFVGATGGYDVAFDLSGADAWNVAYAEITVSETTGSCYTRVCEPGTELVTTISVAEVGWDELGAVWEADLTLAPEGVVEVKARTYDSEGTRLETAKAKLGVPWSDGGYGVNTLATDEDPLTTVALLLKRPKPIDKSTPILYMVVSDGWTLGDTLPVSTSVELTGGETMVVPANSYQVAAVAPLRFVSDEIRFGSGFEASYRVNGVDVTLDGSSTISIADLAAPVCIGGICVTLGEDAEGAYELSVTAYSDDATTLPLDADVVVTLVDKEGTGILRESVTATFDDQVAIVFANEVGFSEDPLGVDLSGQVSLLDAASARGKQKTLAKGKFYGQIARDPAGELGLSGVDSGGISAKGDILIIMEPAEFELVRDDDGDGVVNPPPVVMLRTTGNGKGTRAVATGSNGKPGLL